ncbi:MAG: acylneuraminate cytidylyltransferase family protein [Bacteroidales bacterium]|nr:acylneuraminate cytidylyltransferase family protein [Bacteroidales bacterium]
MTPLYIITARGGSKGIPGKNIKLLGGKPLIAYTIEVARQACAITGGYILLSTDSDRIAEVGRRCGLTVDYMRPAHLGQDNTGSREVMLDAMQWASAQGIPYDCVVLLQPTSPFRIVDDILGALALYFPNLDMVTSVTEAKANPYYTLFELDSQGYIRICKGDGLYRRRQDVPSVMEQNGAVYIINPQSLKQMELGRFPKRVPYMMPQERSLDLDTPLNWATAEVLINSQMS